MKQIAGYHAVVLSAGPFELFRVFNSVGVFEYLKYHEYLLKLPCD